MFTFKPYSFPAEHRDLVVSLEDLLTSLRKSDALPFFFHYPQLQITFVENYYNDAEISLLLYDDRGVFATMGISKGLEGYYGSRWQDDPQKEYYQTLLEQTKDQWVFTHVQAYRHPHYSWKKIPYQSLLVSVWQNMMQEELIPIHYFLHAQAVFWVMPSVLASRKDKKNPSLPLLLQNYDGTAHLLKWKKTPTGLYSAPH